MRLINADSVKRGIAELKQSPWFKYDIGHVERKEAVEVVEHLCIDKEPTIDAVEVVRCKDCVYGKPFNDVWQQPKLNGIIWCAFFETRQEDWFCGYGERRE